MHRMFIAIALMCFAAATAAAQTKVSGTAQCAKPDPQHVIPVGDLPDHSLGVEQAKCTYTKPMEIEGAKSKDGVSTATNDISGDTLRVSGSLGAAVGATILERSSDERESDSHA